MLNIVTSPAGDSGKYRKYRKNLCGNRNQASFDRASWLQSQRKGIEKRAGMDYWKDLDVTTYLDYEEFSEQKSWGQKFTMPVQKHLRPMQISAMRRTALLCLARKAQAYRRKFFFKNQEHCVRIPMINDIRSLNLSNSVAVILYEALRQHNFSHMQLEGQLTKYHWK